MQSKIGPDRGIVDEKIACMVKIESHRAVTVTCTTVAASSYELVLYHIE